MRTGVSGSSEQYNGKGILERGKGRITCGWRPGLDGGAGKVFVPPKAPGRRVPMGTGDHVILSLGFFFRGRVLVHTVGYDG